jgi:predicted NBD/HSP70 family sugar kinase
MYLGVEIGGTKLQLGITNRRGKLLALRRVAVDRRGGRKRILRQIQQQVTSLLADHPVQAIGVGFGGPVDTARGRVVTSHQVAGWSGFRLRAWFEKQFGLPVVVENDTNCAALAEARFGAGRGKRVVFYTQCLEGSKSVISSFDAMSRKSFRELLLSVIHWGCNQNQNSVCPKPSASGSMPCRTR